ncbi:pyridoxal 5'-phosphate synthase glutaminase subunit PdxT [Hallella colorans]|uniref:Pyridoxal 5'-phosphate synthase subunit PdxT n=1 Tax=Hallella colorans TaxID=1703337 RepID=A0A2U0UFQ6_9BACT|nr:pyridoxal 5'-phosphate synthase glutaminase subunit PdxT [Hallella colorans]PVX56495.1 5'-phosphate synthase pdxT subunit [Hallella colorans]
MRIAILALQGAFAEHQQTLQKMGIETFLVRNLSDWRQPKDGLVIPGGESTTMMRLVRDLGLYEPIRQDIIDGLPTFGTCAGLIMLDGEHLGTMSIDVRRNAYGRQLGSFVTRAEMRGVGEVSMVFIRAPYINKVGKDCEVLAIVDGHIVAARQGDQLVTSFHPELSDETAVHQYFIDMCQDRAKRK